MSRFTESIVDEAALDWLRELGYTVVSGSQVLPGEHAALRKTYSDVVLAGVLRGALARLNPSASEGGA